MIRIGFQGLTEGCIKPIHDEKTGKLLAAHIVVYKGTEEEYDTFISPEAYHAYEEYRNLMVKFGEEITKNSSIWFQDRIELNVSRLRTM